LLNRFTLCVCGILLLICLSITVTGYAGTPTTVTNNLDTGSGSLRDTIEQIIDNNNEFDNHLIMESRPVALPHQPLAERYVNLSIHTAPIGKTSLLERFLSS